MQKLKNRIRRSLLFVPGNNPSMIQSCSIFAADTLILDIEDSVAASQKDAARNMIVNAIKDLDFGESEVAVRINHHNTDEGKEDIKTLRETPPDILIVPKIESSKDIIEIDKRLEGTLIGIIPILETPKGVLHGEEIATASKRVLALLFGAEDYAAAMGITRTKKGREIFSPRSLVAMQARSHGIAALDTVVVDVNDEQALVYDTKEAISLGFEGKAAISPRQVGIINKLFTPQPEEIERAQKILEIYKIGVERGLGAIALEGQMIDAPIVQGAERILAKAQAAGLLGGDQK